MGWEHSGGVDLELSIFQCEIGDKVISPEQTVVWRSEERRHDMVIPVHRKMPLLGWVVPAVWNAHVRSEDAK